MIVPTITVTLDDFKKHWRRLNFYESPRNENGAYFLSKIFGMDMTLNNTNLFEFILEYNDDRFRFIIDKFNRDSKEYYSCFVENKCPCFTEKNKYAVIYHLLSGECDPDWVAFESILNTLSCKNTKKSD